MNTMEYQKELKLQKASMNILQVGKELGKKLKEIYYG